MTPRFEKIELYYSSSVTPDKRYPCHIEEALKDIELLANKGLDARAINVEELRDVFRAYHKALSGPDPDEKSLFSQVKGNYREIFGRTIPALLCYAKANDRAPKKVFPKEGDRGIVSINEALKKMVREIGASRGSSL